MTTFHLTYISHTLLEKHCKMFVFLRNRAKRVRSGSTDSECSSIISSPPMIKKKLNQGSNEDLLNDSPVDSVSRQVSRESNISDFSIGSDFSNGLSDDVLMESSQETEMEISDTQEIPPKKAHKEVPCELITEFSPVSKFDRKPCVVSGVSYNAKGDILISDSANSTVKIFNNLGQLKVECSIPDSYGELIEPTGLCTLKTGEILVADRGAGDIKVFSPEGRFMMRFGRDLKRPCDIVSNSQGHVIITDEGSHEIYVYRSLTDKGVIKINSKKNGQKLHQNPQSVTVAKDNEIIVSDHDTNSIFCYTSFGQFICEYTVTENESSSAQNQTMTTASHVVQPALSQPLGLANDRDKWVLIVDSGHSRVVRLDLRMNSLTKEIISNIGASDTFVPTYIATSYQGHMAIIGKGGNLVKIYKYLDYD